MVEVPERLRVSRGQEGWLDAPVAISVNIVAQTPLVAEGATTSTGAEQHEGASGTPKPGLADSGPAATTQTSVVGAFIAGYRAFSGNPAWEARFLAVVECESHWDPYAVSPGGHRGLAQFEPGTWATVAALTGLWDWTDAYSQGANTAVWSSMVLPWSRGGWACWE